MPTDLSPMPSQVVRPTLVPRNSTTTLTVRPGPSLCGRAMIFTATVAAVPPGSGTPSGTVTFCADSGPVTRVALSDGVASFTTPLGAGEHTVTARYAGDTRFKAAPLATLTMRLWRTGF